MILIRSAFVVLLSLTLSGLAAPQGAGAQAAPEPSPALPSIPGITIPVPPAPASQTPAAAPAAPQTAIPQIQRPLELVATITMANGTSETFSREIDLLEVITLPDGRIEMVHLVLVSGGERNTHVWYNFSRMAKLSYRFITLEGRNRIKVRIVQPSTPTRELNERLEPLGPGDYR